MFDVVIDLLGFLVTILLFVFCLNHEISHIQFRTKNTYTCGPQVTRLKNPPAKAGDACSIPW